VNAIYRFYKSCCLATRREGEKSLVKAFFSGFANSTIEGADHGSILGNEQHAQQVSNAILDHVQDVQAGKPLAK
jgi:hypothetical protein